MTNSLLPFRQALARPREQRIVTISQRCREYPDAINLCFGESDLPTPKVVREAAEKAIAKGETRYADRRGISLLRSAIQYYHKQTHGILVDLERISATSSGMTSIMIALQCVIDPGDNVVIIAPVWPNVVIAVESIGAEPRFVPLSGTTGTWTLDLDRVEAACDARTRAIFVASPGNPTGWTMLSSEHRSLLDLAARRGTWVIADEVYNRIVYDGSVATPSILEVASEDEPVFVVQSFSKTWSMTGWRLGWLVHPAALARQVGNLSAINSTGSATFVQHAGVAAIRHGESFVSQMRDRCANGRDLVRTALATTDRVIAPEVPAAFYSFFKIDGVTDDLAYAKELVARAGVGLAPGSAFGPGYDGYFRVCFAQSPERLAQALDRLVGAL